MTVYGERVSPLRPRAYILASAVWDCVSVILLATGAIVISASNDSHSSLTRKGTFVIVAGLASQVARLVSFMGVCVDFARRVNR